MQSMQTPNQPDSLQPEEPKERDPIETLAHHQQANVEELLGQVDFYQSIVEQFPASNCSALRRNAESMVKAT